MSFGDGTCGPALDSSAPLFDKAAAGAGFPLDRQSLHCLSRAHCYGLQLRSPPGAINGLYKPAIPENELMERPGERPSPLPASNDPRNLALLSQSCRSLRTNTRTVLWATEHKTPPPPSDTRHRPYCSQKIQLSHPSIALAIMTDAMPSQPSSHLQDEQQQQPSFGHGSGLAEPSPELGALLSPARPCLPKPQDCQPSSDQSSLYPASDCSALLTDYLFPAAGPQHHSPLRPCPPANEPPRTLDAAYCLLAGWGDPLSSFERLSPSTQEQLLESPYKQTDLTTKNEPLAGEQYLLPGGSHSSGANEAVQMAACGGPPMDSDLPLYQGLPQWEYPSSTQDLAPIQSTSQAGLDFQPSPSLLATSTQTLTHSLVNSNQPSPASAHFISAPPNEHTQSSLEWNPDPSYLVYDPYTQLILEQHCEQSRESTSGLPFLDYGTPFAVPNSPAGHLEPRRVSDPSPVAPVAQRPWDPRQRYSIGNIPCHVSLEGRMDGPQYCDSLKPPYDFPASCAGSSRHSDSFSTTASHFTSGDVPTPSTASFGNEVADQWTQLALQHFEDQVASFGDLAFSHNPSLAPPCSPHQKSPSCQSKSSSSNLAQDPAPSSATGGVGASVSELDTENSQSDIKPVDKQRGRAATISDTLAPSLDSFTSANRAQFTSEYMNVFRQAGQLPFGVPPHRSVSPYAPSAVYPPQVDLLHFSQGPSPFTESFSDPSADSPLFQQFSSREGYIQQQNRLRRLTIMTAPAWPESYIGQRALQPSPSSSFRGYHERAECDLSSTPEKPRGEADSRGGLLRKRKSMKKQYSLTHMAVAEESKQESSGNERGGSDEHLFRDVSFENSDGMSPETTERGGGCSQGSRSNETYTLSRFGGIGQGQSSFPPGLDGSVRPSDLDLAGVIDEAGEMMVPWKQDLRCDEDLYTPMWCRGQNDKKEGFCDMCEGGAWYHKQYFHGVSSTTGHYFYPPREIKRGFSTANRQQILGLCHECEEWVGFSSIIGSGTVKKNHHQLHQQRHSAEEDAANGRWVDADQSSGTSSKIPTLWYKHAHKCHRHQTCKGAKGRKKAKRS
ncbi:hypothetical protein PtA15_9A507 [Puccinia triticina]|uniref:Transcription regulator Rua1 C-terminal domain-containing protein n=1 Tax=Puccinia triticina TaxID=208348 RepID=A0ABY7CUP7_9BASI|nr:uncharacterized protein PtA15_9A507 [Puccinia triticina]WAQ88380.1 hypothetical protein PtA15_9A507 [Puccinia triticina]